jgi:hypothetical protein
MRNCLFFHQDSLPAVRESNECTDATRCFIYKSFTEIEWLL